MSTPQSGAPRIVVGIDGSEPSKVALRWALFMADTLHCDVQAIAVWETSVGWAAGGGWATVPMDWSPGEDTAKMLRDTVREVLGERHPHNVTALVRQGGAAQVLLEASQDANMLIVGSRGHGGFTGLLLGSVSTACAEHSTCPVLVVHGKTPPPPTV
jgi:nucleotide-binding universal stress UspA family protein